MRNNATAKNGAGSGSAGSIFFNRHEMDTNHVNLIGKMTSRPRIYTLPTGRRVAHFTLSTKEEFLDEHGNLKRKSYWHRICARGKWATVMEKLGDEGVKIAIEGKLVTRFYEKSGEREFISEVEVNDLVII